MEPTEPVVEPTEPVSPDVVGNEDATTVPVVTDTPDEIVTLKAERDAAVKRAEQAEMERNMRRKEAEQAKVKALEESEQFKEANAELKRQIEEREAAEAADAEQKQVEELRGKILSEYPDEVQQIAKDLNLYWDNADTTAAAETQLKAKLDAIKSRVMTVGEDGTPTPRVSANNPAPEGDGPKLEDMTSEEMRKILPIAPPR